MIDQIVKDHTTHSYNSAFDILEKLNYFRTISDRGVHNLSAAEIESVRKEFVQFCNVHLTFFADTYPTKLLRITNNKYLTGGKKQKLQNITDLIGPPIGLSKYGRCNLPKESVFYAALDFRTAVWETQPQVGDYITISEWRIRQGEKLNTHIIFHPKLSNVSKDSMDAFNAYVAERAKVRPDIAVIFEELMTFLTEEFMKVIVGGVEDYLFSSIYSSLLIQAPPDKNGFKVDAICYPSVKMEYGLTNLAIDNSIVLDKLELVKVQIMTVAETNYDSKNIHTDDLMSISPLITYAKEFDFLNNKIIYDLEAELKLAIELHEKYNAESLQKPKL